MIGRLLRSFAIRAILSAAIVVYLLADLDRGAFLAALKRGSVEWYAATLGLVAIDRVVMVWRWVILLRAAQVPLGLWDVTRIFLASSFVGSFLPAGVGADVSRAYAVSAVTSRPHEAVASVAVDRLFGTVGILVLALVGLAVGNRLLHLALPAGLVLPATLLALVTVASLWSDEALRWLVPMRWQGSPAGQSLLRLASAVGQYRGARPALASVFLLSVAVQLIRVGQAYCLGTGLGLPIHLPHYLVFMPIGLLLLLLPISIAGVGIPQGGIAWMVAALGVGTADAFALSTLIIAAGIVGNLPGAILYLRRSIT